MAEKCESKNTLESQPEPIDCAVCLQPSVHPTVLPCRHVFCYLCVKGLARTTHMCAMCRQEFPIEILENPSLLQPIDSSLSTGFEDGFQWFYQGRNGGWWQYESRISEEIESIYKSGEKLLEVMICGELYVIDFHTNHQYQKTNPTKRRRIMRSSVTQTKKKGIAGILKNNELQTRNEI